MSTEERYVVVSVFTTLAEADLARVALEGIGIDSHLADGETVAMDWILSNAVGGVKVLVRVSDAPRATQFLSRRRSVVDVDDYGLALPPRRDFDEDEEDNDAEEHETPNSALEKTWKAVLVGLAIAFVLLLTWLAPALFGPGR
jgi:hypothetical protein